MNSVLIRTAMIFAVPLFAGLGWAGGGDDIGNGGGLAEKNVLVAFDAVEKYSKTCLKAEGCRLSLNEKKYLELILKAMPEERKNSDLIQFASGTKQPGLFVINGELKVAKTGSKVGDPIFINTDLIYSANHFGGVEAVSVPMALAILLHEFGHHVTTASHSQLDAMAVKVSAFLQNHVQSTPALPWTQAVMATIYQPPEDKTFPQVLLTVGNSVADISREYRHAIHCPKFVLPIPLLPFPDLELGKMKPLGSLFHNVHWEKASRESQDGKFVILGSVTNTCRVDESHYVAVNSFRVRIYFTVRATSDGKLTLVKNSVQVQQTYEPWYKFFKIPRLAD